MISRSPRWTGGSAAGRPGLRRIRIDGRRRRSVARTRRRGSGAPTRTRAEPLERLAKAVAVGDQQRPAEHAAPALPFGDHVVAGVGRHHQRHREPLVAMLQHDGEPARLVLVGRNDADRDAEEFGNLERRAACGTPRTARRTTTCSRSSSIDRSRSSARASLVVKLTGSAHGSSRSARLDPAGMALPATIRRLSRNSRSLSPGSRLVAVCAVRPGHALARSLPLSLATRRRNPLKMAG